MPRLKKHFLRNAILSIIAITTTLASVCWWRKLNLWKIYDVCSERRFRAVKFLQLEANASSRAKLPEHSFVNDTLSSKLKFNSLIGIGPKCSWIDICISANTIEWRMFIFVKSVANHNLRRTNIRSTWGAVKYVDGGQISTIFLVGKAKDAKEQALLEVEDRKFEDILQVDVNDDYRHIVFKTLSGMQWASKHLNNDDYYSSCDDDMMVNIGRLQEYIEKYDKKRTKNDWPEFPLLCGFKLGTSKWKPERNKKHKNYVSLEEYKWKDWPRFCLGGMYTTSVSVIKQLYEASRTIKPIRTDDVYITGLLRNEIGMPDTMIAFPQPVVAQHLDIYVKLQAKMVKRSIFQNHWRKILRIFKCKSVCKC